MCIFLENTLFADSFTTNTIKKMLLEYTDSAHTLHAPTPTFKNTQKNRLIILKFAHCGLSL